MFKDLFSLLLIFIGLLLFISLVSFNQTDPSLNHTVSGDVEIKNWGGVVGAYTSGLLADLLGISSYFLALGIFGLAMSRSIPSFDVLWWRWLGLLMLALAIAGAGSFGDIGLGEIRGGGILGALISSVAVRLLSVPGAVLAWIFLILACVYLITGVSWLRFLKLILSKIYKKPPQKAPEPAKPRPRTYTRIAKTEEGIQATSGTGATPAADARTSASKVKKEASKLAGVNFGAVLGKVKRIFGKKVGVVASESPELLSQRERATIKPLGREEKLVLSSMRTGGEECATPSPLEIVDPADFPVGKFHTDQDNADEYEPDTWAEAGETRSGKEPGKSLPPITLLTELVVEKSVQASVELEERGRDLMDCLADFSIQGKLLRIVPGPVVTMFEIRPAPGVKISRIASLGDDIALAMRAIAVRVQAPIPGTDAVGIEIPNEKREMVSFREIISSLAFRDADSLLSMALGKDITGEPAVADLAKMPHLLVAGATGAGKSVCLNSILLSLIFKATPDELKLLLIDPKRIELAVYADLPHLVHPVVTEMTQAKSALDWAVHEMDKRYEAIARLGVRNVAGYNEKLAELRKRQPEPPEVIDVEPMPYLVIVIDELADLMLTAGKEVEVAIVRLAQLARAAGIHLIIATQRPSVDVVTGLIKANFPCRISFQVTSKHDSRTILDTVGAEHLLGKGDMLMKPGGGRMQRLHGAFVPDMDVVASVGFWKKMAPPRYEVDLSDWGSPDVGQGGGSMGAESGGSGATYDDPLYSQAVGFVMEQGKASISLIQRRFRIGFNKAARFVEQMEQDGIIGPPDGSRPRQVINK